MNDSKKSKINFHVTSNIQNDFKVTNNIERFEMGHEVIQHSQPFDVKADQPIQLCGSDTAPTPEELLLSSLGTCLSMAFLSAAKVEKIILRKVDVKLRGKIDLRSVFDATGKYQRGFRAIVA